MLGRPDHRRCQPLLTLLVLLSSGCVPEETSALFDEQDVGVVEDSGRRDAGATTASFSDLTGTWALMTDESLCVEIFDNQETRAYTILLVQTEQRGYRLTERMQVCSVVTTPVLGVETLIPRAVADSTGEIEVSSAIYGDTVGATYVGGTIAQIWGIALHDPIGDDFPAREDLPDERIFDADEDGNPGVTLQLGGDFCQLFVIQRSLSSLYGTAMADGSIEGPSSVLTQQTVIGASNEFCSQSFATRPNGEFGRARMVRVDEAGLDLDEDDDGVDCDELIANQDRLITWTEPDDVRCE